MKKEKQKELAEKLLDGKKPTFISQSCRLYLYLN